MGIRFNCPSGHKLNVKEFLAGKRGVCPQCGAKFIIPMPSEAPTAETPLSVGIGQTQSIEIAVSPAPSRQVASPSASPSVIIPVTDVELAAPDLQSPQAIPGQQIPVADVLPASIVAVQPPIVPATIGGVIPLQRGRSRRYQVVISLLLLALVILLAGVLVWVLQQEVNTIPPEQTTAVGGEFNHACAFSGNDLLMRTDPRVGAPSL